MSSHPTTPELVSAVRRAKDDGGWTWREVEDAGGPSTTLMGRLYGGTQERVRIDVLKKLDAAFGWPAGTSLSLVASNTRVRRTALAQATVGPPGQARPHQQGTGRGEDDALVNEERKMVGEAARLLAQAAEILAKIAAPEDDD